MREYVQPESNSIGNKDFRQSIDSVSTPSVDFISGFEQVGVTLFFPIRLNLRYPGIDRERLHFHSQDLDFANLPLQQVLRLSCLGIAS